MTKFSGFLIFQKLIYFRTGVIVSSEIVTICHQKSPFVTSLVTRSHYVTRMWAENVTTVINVTICDQLQLYLSIWNKQLFFQRTLRIMLIRGEIVEQMVDDSTILADIRICNFKHRFWISLVVFYEKVIYSLRIRVTSTTDNTMYFISFF